MTFPQDQIDELKTMFPGLLAYDEGGNTFFLLPNAELPPGCTPARMDLLLCPTPRDGYPCRLFFAERVSCSKQPNWNGHARIIDRNWHAFSWKRDQALRLAQMVVDHLGGLR